MTLRSLASSGSARRVVDAIAKWQFEYPIPLVVGIDGHGAAGKSTIAEQVAEELVATLVHVDDFMLSPTTQESTAGPTMAAYYDWQRLRQEALEPLLAGLTATFRAFDWEANGFRYEPVTLAPSALILLEGVSATAPALSDLIDRTVLVDTPEPERLERLHVRVTSDVWDENWLQAEQTYFATRPPEAFDLIVSGSTHPIYFSRH